MVSAAESDIDTVLALIHPNQILALEEEIAKKAGERHPTAQQQRYILRLVIAEMLEHPHEGQSLERLKHDVDRNEITKHIKSRMGEYLSGEKVVELLMRAQVREQVKNAGRN